MKAPDRIETRSDGDHYYLGHREVARAEYEAAYPPPKPCAAAMPGKAVTTWRKPVRSVSQAVHPDQIAEAKAEDARRGLGETEYTADGAIVFRDRASRRAYLKAYQKVDRDSYTGY